MDKIPQHIISIPSIGPVVGAIILGEIGDIYRFEGREQLIIYTGINPSIYETGQFKVVKTHMSKCGSPYRRQAVWRAVTKSAILNHTFHTLK
jgi:transposase